MCCLNMDSSFLIITIHWNIMTPYSPHLSRFWFNQETGYICGQTDKDAGPKLRVREAPSWMTSAFNCCGATVLSHMPPGRFFNSTKEKEEFLHCWVSNLGDSPTYYFIASTFQLKANLGVANTVLEFLITELGAVQIDSSPNRYHGPNQMVLYRLCLHPDVNTAVAKFVAMDHTSGYRTCVPLWWSKLTKETQKQYLIDHEKQILETQQYHKSREKYAETMHIIKQKNTLISLMVYHPEEFLKAFEDAKNHLKRVLTNKYSSIEIDQYKILAPLFGIELK